MPEPTLEAWAQIRHDYEHTDKPLAHICAEHGITVPMMRYRVKRWEWQRRRPLIPRHGPPPVPVMPQENAAAAPAPCAAPVHPTPPAFAHTSAGDPHPPEPAPGRAQARPGWEGEDKIVPRLQAAVAQVLPAIEATIARLAGGTHHPRDMEQAGRALGALTRTLRELNALLAQHNARLDTADRYNDDLPEDMPEDLGPEDLGPEDLDAFRIDLARRIDSFVASRMNEDGAQPGSGLGLEAQK